jgi:amidase/formamidase
MNIGNCYPLNGKIETEALSVVLLQMSPAVDAESIEDTDKNIDKVFEYIDRATLGHPGFDIIATPEIILNGYSDTFYRSIIKLDSAQIRRLRNKCRDLQIWGIFGLMLDLDDGLYPRNCALTINDRGEIVNNYIKTNPWIPVESFTPGDEIQVFDGPKGSRIATIICSDGDYIDTWLEAAHKGANIIFRISEYMTPYQDAFEITNRAGAYFTRCYVLATNTSELSRDFCNFGRTMAVNPDGNIISEAPIGIPFIIKVDVYPGLVDHIQKQAFMGNLLWQGNHRGASSPETKGLGRDKSMYKHLNNPRGVQK